jgi:hypothetical protein
MQFPRLTRRSPLENSGISQKALNKLADGMSVGSIYLANGGLTFLLLPFQYLVGWEKINLAISMNSFRLMHIEIYQRRSLAPVR